MSAPTNAYRAGRRAAMAFWRTYTITGGMYNTKPACPYMAHTLRDDWRRGFNKVSGEVLPQVDGK